jgi:hypothetical protein
MNHHSLQNVTEILITLHLLFLYDFGTLLSAQKLTGILFEVKIDWKFTIIIDF